MEGIKGEFIRDDFINILFRRNFFFFNFIKNLNISRKFFKVFNKHLVEEI